METGNMGTTNETLSAKLDATSAQIGEVKAQINAFGTIYARSDLLEFRFKELDAQIANINLEIVRIQKSTEKVDWKSKFLLIILTAVVTLLLSYAVNGILK